MFYLFVTSITAISPHPLPYPWSRLPPRRPRHLPSCPLRWPRELLGYSDQICNLVGRTLPATCPSHPSDPVEEVDVPRVHVVHPQDVLHLIGVSVVEKRRAVLGLRYPRLGPRHDERAQELGDPPLVQRDPHHLELGRVPPVTKLFREGVHPRREELRPELLARKGDQRALRVGVLGAVVPGEEVGEVDRLAEEVREPRELREGLRLVRRYDVVVRQQGLFVRFLELLDRPEVTKCVLYVAVPCSVHVDVWCYSSVMESAMRPIDACPTANNSRDAPRGTPSSPCPSARFS